MTDPMLASTDEFERALWTSARENEVPEASRQRVALALGLPGSAAAGGFEPSSPAFPSLTSAKVVGVGVAGSGHGKLALRAKCLLVGLGGGIAALAYLGSSSDAPSSSSNAVWRVVEASDVSSDVELAARAVVPPPAPPALAAAVAVERDVTSAGSRDKPPPRVRHRAAASNVELRPAASEVESRLLAEVKLLDEARAALAASSATLALGWLEQYRTQFPDGTLALEAAVLEAKALSASGQHAAAHHLARRTLYQPGSARYRSELEALINPLASGSKERLRNIGGAR